MKNTLFSCPEGRVEVTALDARDDADYFLPKPLSMPAEVAAEPDRAAKWTHDKESEREQRRSNLFWVDRLTLLHPIYMMHLTVNASGLFARS